MKRVTFEHGDFSVSIQADNDGEVQIMAEGITEENAAVEIHGWFPADEARQIAAYLIEMADAAEFEAKKQAVGA